MSATDRARHPGGAAQAANRDYQVLLMVGNRCRTAGYGFSRPCGTASTKSPPASGRVAVNARHLCDINTPPSRQRTDRAANAAAVLLREFGKGALSATAGA